MSKRDTASRQKSRGLARFNVTLTPSLPRVNETAAELLNISPLLISIILFLSKQAE